MGVTKETEREIDSILIEEEKKIEEQKKREEKRKNKANNRWILAQKILFSSILMLLVVTFMGTPLFPWAIRYHYRGLTPFLITGLVSAFVCLLSIETQSARQLIRTVVLIAVELMVLIFLIVISFSADINSFEKKTSERRVKIWVTEGFSEGIDKKGAFVRKLSSFERFKELDEGGALINKKISYEVINNENIWSAKILYSGRLTGNKVNNLTRTTVLKTVPLSFIKGNQGIQKIKINLNLLKKGLVIKYHKTKGPEGLPLFNLPIFNK